MEQILKQTNDIFNLFFHLPDGSVWPNIIAAIMVTILGRFWAKRHFKAIHQSHQDMKQSLDDLHTKVDNGLRENPIAPEEFRI